MSEAIKPTPGPWVAVGSGGPWEQRISIRAANWGTVAAVGVDPSLPHWDGPQRANARLIASAPELLHACEVALAAMESGPGTDAEASIIRAAIAKATGDGE